MLKTFNVLLDTVQATNNPSFSVNTNDLKTLQFNITIQQNEVPLDLSNATVKLAVKKPDNKTTFQDVTVVYGPSGTCQVTLDTQSYMVPGYHKAEAMIYNGTDVVAVTSYFSYTATKGILDDTTIESTTEFQAINQIVSDAENIKSDAQASADSAAASATLAQNTVNEKADKTYVDTQLSSKANQTSLDTTNATVGNKADKTYVDTQLGTKANQSSLDTTNANVAANTSSLAEIASINLKNQYVLKTGQTLYYDSVTNKHWYDTAFTQAPQPVADILNQAFIDYTGKDAYLVIPAGYYLIDKPLTLQDGVGLVGVPGKTKFIVDDTFANGGGDYIVTNTSGANVYIDGISIEYKGFKTPCFSNPADVPNGKEGMILKMSSTSSLVIKNSSFIVKNNGIKTRCTAIWARDGYNNVEISNNYIEHTSSGISTGCLWFMCNTGATGQNVKVHDNTIIHSCADEPIGIWGDGTHQDYEIYNNIISIPTDAYNTQVARLISIFSNDTGTFKNIKVHSNDIKLYGLVQHVCSVSVSQATFTNILFENNSIVEYAVDATNNILLYVFDVTATYNDANYQALYQRSEVVARRNSYVSKNAGGRRSFAYAQSAFLKLIENVVSGYFGYGIIYDQYTSSYSKIVSIGNDYNYSSLNNYPAWKATTKYNVGDLVLSGSNVYQCTVAGTSGSTSPNFTSGTATDGTVTWLYLSARLLCMLGTLAGNYLNIKFSGDKIAASSNLIMFNGNSNTNITDITVENCIIGGNGWDLFYLYSSGNANSRLNFINNVIGETYNALFYAPDTFTVSIGNANFRGNKFLNTLANMSYADNASNTVVANSTITVNSNTYKNGETDNLVKAAPTNTNIFKLFETARVMLNIGSGTNRCWTKQSDGTWLSS